MYKEFYHFSAEPFRITPDPGFLYLTDQHKEALASIIYGIAKRKGFVCITGEVGVGKTTILRSYLDSADEPGLRFVYVFNPNVSFLALLKHIAKEIGLETSAEDIAGLVEALRASLVERHKRHETLVLLIDEAQNMPIGTLESLRMLSNLETSTEKLVQIVLVGQPELEHLLAERQLRQLESRIAIRTRLGPLSASDSASYIRHRLKCVALDDKPAFTDGAIRLIVRRARGIPRRINVLCDTALMTGFGRKVRPVTTAIVREVLRDQKIEGARARGLPSFDFRVPWRAIALGGGALVSIAAVIAIVTATGRTPSVLAPHPLATSVPAVSDKPHEAAARPLSSAPGLDAALPAPATVPPSPPPSSFSPTENSSTPDVAAAPQPEQTPAAETFPKKPDVTNQQPAEPLHAAIPDPNPSASAPQPTAAQLQTLAIKPSSSADAEDAVRIAAPGDTLAGLTFEVYGKSDGEHLDWVKAHNPDIVNIDRIQVGQVIEFPAFPAKSH